MASLDELDDQTIHDSPYIAYHSPTIELENRAPKFKGKIAYHYRFSEGRTASDTESLVFRHPYMEAIRAKSYAAIRGAWHFLKHDRQKLIEVGINADRLKEIEDDFSRLPFPKVVASVQFLNGVSELVDDPNNPYKAPEIPPSAELKAEFLLFANELWAKLVRLNPELRSIEIDRTNSDAVTHAILGVTSLFNPNDIQSWLDREPTDSRLVELQKRYNAENLGWKPSNQTLVTIFEALEADMRPEDRTLLQEVRQSFSGRKRS